MKKFVQPLLWMVEMLHLLAMMRYCDPSLRAMQQLSIIDHDIENGD